MVIPYLCSAFLFFGFQSFSLLVDLGFHFVVIGPQLLTAVQNELSAQAVELADQVENLLDEEAGVANTRLPRTRPYKIMLKTCHECEGSSRRGL